VFLDDVDALSLDLQGRLLAVIENRSIQRLGGVAARSLDVRVIAASHADLADAVPQHLPRESARSVCAIHAHPTPPA
jgi:transcriptional regulator with PAS, ATPase and Fis domain